MLSAIKTDSDYPSWTRFCCSCTPTPALPVSLFGFPMRAWKASPVFGQGCRVVADTMGEVYGPIPASSGKQPAPFLHRCTRVEDRKAPQTTPMHGLST
jgi:hypothetical protein